MVFSNLFFIYVFLPICICLYYLPRSLKIKNYVLLAASLVFYGLGEPVYILLMTAATFSAFYFAKKIDKKRGTRTAKILLAVSVVINVSALFFFKYLPLFIETANTITGADFTVLSIAMPIGISFYTFQILTYTVDIYNGKTPVQKSFSNFLLYVSLFPQLIAGPIVRYTDIEEQLTERKMTIDKFVSGICCFVCGLAKKVIIADYAGKIADNLLMGADLPTAAAWMGIVTYTFQIYFDFSGYSDMAIGLGRMFGFEYVKNFDYPYISKSITEFWRRWHISLGTFFRDYVYIPLGGNRRRHIRNILVVWLLTGFWHGASWNFALWGLYFGIILLVEKYVLSRIKFAVPRLIKWLLSFFLVILGWVVFYFTDLGKMADTFTALFTYRPFNDYFIETTVLENITFIIVCLFASMPFAKQLYVNTASFLRAKNETAAAITETVLMSAYVLAVLFVVSAILVGSTFSPFLYFRF